MAKTPEEKREAVKVIRAILEERELRGQEAIDVLNRISDIIKHG